MAYSTSMIESIGSKPIVPEFITSKITDRKLNRDNYLQQREIVEINLTGRGKTSHMYMDPFGSKMNE